MASNIDEACVQLKVNLAPLQASLKRVRSETAKTSAEMLKSLGGVGGAVAQLRSQFVDLEKALPPSNAAVSGLEGISKAADSARSNVAALKDEVAKFGDSSGASKGSSSSADVLPTEASFDQKVEKAIEDLKELEELKKRLGGDSGGIGSRLENAATFASVGALIGPIAAAASALAGTFGPEILDAINFSTLEKLESLPRTLADLRKKLSEEQSKLARTLTDPEQKKAPLHANEVKFLEKGIAKTKQAIALTERELREAEAQASRQLEILRKLKQSSQTTGAESGEQGAAGVDSLASKIAALVEAIGSGLSSALQNNIQSWQAWREAVLQEVCAVQEKLQKVGETLETIPLPDGAGDLNQPSTQRSGIDAPGSAVSGPGEGAGPQGRGRQPPAVVDEALQEQLKSQRERIAELETQLAQLAEQLNKTAAAQEGLKSATAEAGDAAASAVEQAERTIGALKGEVDAINQGEEAYARYQDARDLQSNIDQFRQSLLAAEVESDQVNRLTEQYGFLVRAKEEAIKKLETLREEQAKNKQVAQDFASIIVGGLRDARDEIDSLDEALLRMAERLQKLIEEEVIFKPLEKFLAKQIEASGFSLGNLFGLFDSGDDRAGTISVPFGGGVPTLPDGSAPTFDFGLVQDSANNLATTFDTAALAALGAGTGLEATGAAGVNAGNVLVSQFVQELINSAIASAQEAGASLTVSGALAELTGSAIAAAAALQQVGGGGGVPGGGGGGGFLSGLFGGFGGGGGGLGPQFTGTGLEGLLASGSFAAGGDPLVGRFALVGERGPELIVPKIPTRIFSNRQTRALLADGGEAGASGLSLVQNITINGRLTAAERTENLAQAREMGFAAVNAYRASINRGGPDAKLSGRRQ